MPEQSVTTPGLQVTVAAADDHTRLTLTGQIDEHADLVGVAARLDGATAIDLAGVRFINSVGVREWIRMLSALAERGVAVTLHRCSEPMTQQFNMIVESTRNVKVASFCAPYECDGCGAEVSVEIDIDTHRALLDARDPPPATCPDCSAPMEFADLPERYFLFLD